MYGCMCVHLPIVQVNWYISSFVLVLFSCSERLVGIVYSFTLRSKSVVSSISKTSCYNCDCFDGGSCRDVFEADSGIIFSIRNF